MSRPAMLALSIGIAAVNSVLFFVFLLRARSGSAQSGLYALFSVLAIAQLVAALAAVVSAVRARRAGTPSLRGIVAGALCAIGAVLGWASGSLVFGLSQMGGAWGRPLRVRGRQIHPSLTEGADWTDGDRPDPHGLDAPTRRALELLWLHDAQKEHASVPAFARVSWLLAAAGAPAELLIDAHRAAIEEIAHTRACFALAAGYGCGRTHTVLPMPELLLGGLDGKVDPRVTLAAESLADGCQLEDFNADVAAACAAVCEEPVTRAVLVRIAREERSHADFSWAVLDWALARHGHVVRGPIAEALARLDEYPRPTAVAHDRRDLVDRADAAQLLRHGRLPDRRWAELWDARLVATRRRVHQRLAARAA